MLTVESIEQSTAWMNRSIMNKEQIKLTGTSMPGNLIMLIIVNTFNYIDFPRLQNR
jgi:hypothetical protein